MVNDHQTTGWDNTFYLSQVTLMFHEIKTWEENCGATEVLHIPYPYQHEVLSI